MLFFVLESQNKNPVLYLIPYFDRPLAAALWDRLGNHTSYLIPHTSYVVPDTCTELYCGDGVLLYDVARGSEIKSGPRAVD